MRTRQRLLPPSSSLPPLAKLTHLSEDRVLSALQELCDLYCPLAFQLSGDRRVYSLDKSSETADSGYVSGAEEEEDVVRNDLESIDVLRNDAFERSFSERWLTGFIARADGLSCLETDEKREFAVERASHVLESFYTSTASREEDGENDQTYSRDFSFDLTIPDSSQAIPTAIKVQLNDGLAGRNSHDPDDVGLQSWGASIVVSRLMCESPSRFRLTQDSFDSTPGPRIIELGAGTGLVSLVLARMLPHLGMPDARVVATDYHPAVLANLRDNIAANFPEPEQIGVEASFLDWSAPSLAPPLDVPADMLVATDVVYAREHAVWLRDCATRLLKPKGVFWLVATVRENGRFAGISETVEAAFSAGKGVLGEGNKPRLKILQAEALEKRRFTTFDYDPSLPQASTSSSKHPGMAAVTSPSLTSTSHTLTAGPSSIMAPPPLSNGSNALGLLERLRPGQQHTFLQPNPSIPNDALHLVKDTLEAFAGQVSDEQQVQLAESRKRKRPPPNGGEVLTTRKVFVENFDTTQVWQQANRIIGKVLDHSTRMMDELEAKNEAVASGGEPANSETSDEVNPAQEDLESEDSQEGEEEDGESNSEDDQFEDAMEDGPEEDDLLELEDGEPDMEVDPEGGEDGEDDEDDEDDDELQQELVEDPNGLNDGFFSIDDFNRQTQLFEEQDAKGDPNTDRVSDEEDIDWDADPLAPTTAGTKRGKGKLADDALPDLEGEDDDEDDDDAGPTFGNMDLDAPEGDSEDEALNDALENGEDDDDGMNANDIYYKDFFAPPAKKRNKNKVDKPRKTVSFQPKEAEVERVMDDVRRELFDDESEYSDEEALSDVSVGNPKSRRSAHERRQAKLAEEIRKLEAASVAKREWTLVGEATAAERPMNSLLEEDLDFEHLGKPVPVITPEVSDSIDALIKRRILAQEFDEVLRRRPDAESVPSSTRRGMLENVDDTKDTKGLAEVYEEEHVKKTNPNAYVSASDAALQREEREVEAMWTAVCGQLDALSNWHYRPKPAAPTISVVADVATIAMEDAQPAAAQGMGGAGAGSRMAPQEVYQPNAEAGEVVTSAGLPVAREEMSREEKLRRRRRAKERSAKAGSGKNGAQKPLSKAASTMADLKKGGVKVINRKGEITDIQGNKAKKAKPVTSGGFKL
ncbi:hypothetical protein S40293_06729 [Stachybotrys chartarum IBT 40293]|nr:hypothetical protein S40293_06729 [Stachybotrys chartarum IBT 40293]